MTREELLVVEQALLHLAQKYGSEALWIVRRELRLKEIEKDPTGKHEFRSTSSTKEKS